MRDSFEDFPLITNIYPKVEKSFVDFPLITNTYPQVEKYSFKKTAPMCMNHTKKTTTCTNYQLKQQVLK